jgi:thiol-disulfide isomerase/thioredoxin
VTLLLCTLLAVQPRFLGPPEKKPDAGSARPVQAGEVAPPLSGEIENPPDGGPRTFDLSTIVGPGAAEPASAVLIAFYASGCADCAEELRLVRQLAGEYRSSGLRAVVVDLDGDGAPTAPLLDGQGAAILIVKDRRQVAARRWLGAKPELPALVVVGREGNVRATAASCGAEGLASLRAGIDGALAR